MHYCLYLYTDEFPTDDVIDRALKPYNSKKWYEGLEEGGTRPRPVFTWDWWQIGGRYAGKLKLKAIVTAPDDHDIDKYQFGFYVQRRAGRLFRQQLLEKVAREDYLTPIRGKVEETDVIYYMGLRDKFLYVDGAWIPDLTNFDEEADKTFCVIDADGTAAARETWDGNSWITDENFDAKLKQIAEKNRNDCYLAVIDIHD